MASVRGILNIQSLIELSSENLFYIRGLHAVAGVCRVSLRHASHRNHRSLHAIYIVSRMGFCRAIAMIAKLNERNTFVVSNPARRRFAGARRPGLNRATPHAGSRNRTL